MPDVLIRNVPRALLADAKEIAAAHHRSLQQELRNMLEESIRFATGRSVEAAAKRKTLGKTSDHPR